MRYQFYREHKYVSATLNDLERLIARTDFSDLDSVREVENAFESLAGMLKGHAQYENERLHTLLKQKNVPVAIYEHEEEDHATQDEQLLEIEKIFRGISLQNSEEEKIREGYRLYLTYRKFMADNLAHLHEEETHILPELQKLYSDAELRQVEAYTYREMDAAQMVDMIKVLFPHMNIHDKQAFLFDIYSLEPKKIDAVLKGIQSILTEKENIMIEQMIKTSILLP